MANEKKSLKYFMREPETEIVTAPGPETFKDEEGNTIQFEIRVLTQKEIQEMACSQKQANERIKKRRREKRRNPPHDSLIKILWYYHS